MLEECADRVVVDTFFGDGSGGKRTAHRPLPARFAELGLGDWRETGCAERLHQTLLDRMGPERAGWSQDGFNDLAVRTAPSAAAAAALVGGAWRSAS
jgi:hypothetical protein